MVRPQRTFSKSWVTLGSNLSVSVGLWFVWHRSRYGQGNLEGNRFRIHRNGTLEIKRIQIEDQGTYLCVISNIAGRDENQVRVEVKGKDDTENVCHQEALLMVWQFVIIFRAHNNCDQTTEYESPAWKWCAPGVWRKTRHRCINHNSMDEKQKASCSQLEVCDFSSSLIHVSQQNVSFLFQCDHLSFFFFFTLVESLWRDQIWSLLM